MDSKDLFNNNNNETSKECPISPLFECFPECLVDVFADVQGVIPPWLSGSLVRVGPGKFKYGEQEVKHWFDGAGILHKFSVAEGRVTFQSKFIESEAYKNNTAQQRITVAEFGTSITPDPCASKFARFKSWFQLPPKGDNVNINVFKYGDFLVACTDSPVFQTVTQDLNTVGSVDLTEVISLTLATAHPHFGENDSIYISGSSFKGRPNHHIVRIPPYSAVAGTDDPRESLAKAEIICSIPSRSIFNPSYSHSFGMTENYFIYCETTVSLSLIKTVGKVLSGAAVNDAFSYDPQEMAVFHIISRATGEVLPTKYQIPGLFFFHTINSYEDENHIVLDLCSFSDFQTADLFTQPIELFKNNEWKRKKHWSTYKHYPLRLVFPLSIPQTSPSNSNLVKLKDTTCTAYRNPSSDLLIDVTSERLLPEGEDRIDIPQINYAKCNGRKYRYFYGTGLIVNQYFANALGKVDVVTKSSLRWRGSASQYPSEPVFVPHPDATLEDDGVVLASVCDVDPSKRDFLLVLDGKTFQELARAYVPEKVRVPYSIHGSYYSI